MKELSIGKKLSYASGGMALNLANLVISQWLLKLYVPSRDAALVSVSVFTVIFLIGRIVDGVIDPLVGYWSDHLKSKRGRRIPFIMIAFIPVAVVSFFLWTPPFPDQLHWLNGVYIFVFVQLFFILWTILANPYMALLPEITSNLKERVNVSTLQALFLMIGTFIFAVIGPVKEAFGWIGIGAVVGVITIISFLPTVLFIKEKKGIQEKIDKKKINLSVVFSWAATTFKNRPFLFLLAATSVFWFSLPIVLGGAWPG